MTVRELHDTIVTVILLGNRDPLRIVRGIRDATDASASEVTFAIDELKAAGRLLERAGLLYLRD